MNRQPDIYRASAIKNWDTDTELPNGLWVPARPMGHNAFSPLWRWKIAWLVLTGQADALVWDQSV